MPAHRLVDYRTPIHGELPYTVLRKDQLFGVFESRNYTLFSVASFCCDLPAHSVCDGSLCAVASGWDDGGDVDLVSHLPFRRTARATYRAVNHQEPAAQLRIGIRLRRGC